MSVSGLRGIADDDLPGQLDEPLGKRIGDRVDDVEALGRRADLARIEIARPHRTARGDIEVGVLADDEGIDAARLEIHPLQRIGGDAA